MYDIQTDQWLSTHSIYIAISLILHRVVITKKHCLDFVIWILLHMCTYIIVTVFWPQQGCQSHYYHSILLQICPQSPVMLFVFIRCVGKPKLQQRELLLFNIHRECLLTIALASSKTIMQHFVMCRKMTVERQSEKVISAW